MRFYAYSAVWGVGPRCQNWFFRRTEPGDGNACPLSANNADVRSAVHVRPGTHSRHQDHRAPAAFRKAAGVSLTGGTGCNGIRFFVQISLILFTRFSLPQQGAPAERVPAKRGVCCRSSGGGRGLPLYGGRGAQTGAVHIWTAASGGPPQPAVCGGVRGRYLSGRVPRPGGSWVWRTSRPTARTTRSTAA